MGEEFEYLQEKMNSNEHEEFREVFERLKAIKTEEDLENFLKRYQGYKGGGISSAMDIETAKDKIAYQLIEDIYRPK